ncbi:hypothetical protein INR49_024154, partial [Caranx melampygus]
MEPKSLLNHSIPPDLNGWYNCGYGAIIPEAASQQETPPEVREPSHGISNPCILQRPPVLPGIHPVDRVGST